MQTRLTEMLQIEHPVMLAGMGGVSYHEVVAAVSDAGGFGCLGASAMSNDRLVAEMAGVRERTDRGFGVDLLTAMPGDMAMMKGRKAVEGKGQWWYANNTVHDVKVEGPYVAGDQFVVRFKMDVTPKGKTRQTMDEVGVYTVKNGKIVEESFFYGE